MIALALLEFDSIAAGIRAGDAMAKRAPLESIHAGTVHPGRYLVLLGGAVADVEESLAAGREAGWGSLRDVIYLPAVHPRVVGAMTGARRAPAAEALGVIETSTVPAVIGAADAALKAAAVELLEVHLADGLGGKAYALLAGAVADVEAAVEAGTASLIDPELLIARVVVPQLHGEMWANLLAAPQFNLRLRDEGA